MSNIKIVSRVDKSNITEEEAIAKAISTVKVLDGVNKLATEELITTKLYYILPILGRIIVVISDEDKVDLGVDSNVLSNIIISTYPLVRLPSDIIEYRELLVKVGSTLTEDEINDVAQAMAVSEELDVNKIPIVKIINYNTNVDKLVSSEIYGTSLPQTGSNISADITTSLVNNGDSAAGELILNTSDVPDFSSLGENITFIGPDGDDDLNDGSYNSPYASLRNVPENSTVVIKNGTYTQSKKVSSYTAANNIFHHNDSYSKEKSGISMIGEDRSKVLIYVYQADGERDMPVIHPNLDSCNLANVTIDFNSVGITKAARCSITKSKGIVNYDNVIFNITGNYSTNYQGADPYYNNCEFNGGTLLSNYLNASFVINETSDISPDPF